MSEVNWELIDKLSRRFDQLVGLASTEQLSFLLDNFQLVQTVMNGRLDKLLTEFVSMEPAEGVRNVDWHGVRERLRQYSVRTDQSDHARALLAAGIVCDDSAARHEVDRLDAAGESSGWSSLRMKLIRFDCPANFNTVETVLRAKELAPASLEQLICFAAQYPDDLPDQLIGSGTLSVAPRRDGQDGLDEPSGIFMPVVCRERGPRQSGRLMFRHYDRLLSSEWSRGKVFLTVRYPRERQANRGGSRPKQASGAGSP